MGYSFSSFNESLKLFKFKAWIDVETKELKKTYIDFWNAIIGVFILVRGYTGAKEAAFKENLNVGYTACFHVNFAIKRKNKNWSR